MTEASYKTSPKDIFLQLLAIVTLYGSAAGFLTLLFQFINIQFPDPLSYSNVESARYSIRFAVSSLVIVFPVYVWIMKFLGNIYRQEPARKEVRIRKWLVYLTLFATGLIIMGDLVALVNSFLNGELTTRFLLKICSVFIVSGAVFWYYYWDVKDVVPSGMELFRWTVLVVVTVGIASAFFFVGSPKQERMRQFDQQRTNDLQTIQWQIVNYWQKKGVMPTSLDMIEDDISGFRVPRDPETNGMYEYTLKGNMIFELCAVFSLPSADVEVGSKGMMLTPQPDGFGGNWQHAAGHVCFERTIDPQLYPPQKGLEKPMPVR